MKEDHDNDLGYLVRRAQHIQQAMRERGITTELTEEEARMKILSTKVYVESDNPGKSQQEEKKANG